MLQYRHKIDLSRYVVHRTRREPRQRDTRPPFF